MSPRIQQNNVINRNLEMLAAGKKFSKELDLGSSQAQQTSDPAWIPRRKRALFPH